MPIVVRNGCTKMLGLGVKQNNATQSNIDILKESIKEADSECKNNKNKKQSNKRYIIF